MRVIAHAREGANAVARRGAARLDYAKGKPWARVTRCDAVGWTEEHDGGSVSDYDWSTWC